MSYNIPKVATKIVDQSELAAVQSGGRVVLIPYCSKYGTEDFTTLYSQFDKDGEHVLLGKENAKRYGLGVTFIKGALSVPGVEVLGRRLLPADAQYANKTRSIVTTQGAESIVDASVDTTTIEGLLTNATGTRFALHAAARGLGYNDIAISTRIDRDMELTFADDEGKVLYPYNFFISDVYESTSKGLVLLEAGIRFSLMEADPDGNAFINPVTNVNLFFKNIESKYMGIVADQTAIDAMEDIVDMTELRTDANLGTGAFPLIKDKTTGATYELKEDAGHIVIERAQAGDLDAVELQFDMITGGDNPESVKIEIDNKQIVITKSGKSTLTKGIVAGGSSFKYVTVSDELTLVVGDSVLIQRTAISEFLTGSKYIKLSNGKDGAGLANGSRFNMSNNVGADTANGKSLLVNFYSKSTELYETIFPKYAFDYVVDWSGEDAVKSAINNLTSNIGITLGLVSAPYSTVAEKDTDWRADVFYASNMHTAIYSGQTNTAHYDASAKTNISMMSSYYAMIKHLSVDNTYSITEPVANITKGQLPVAGAKLSYAPNSAEIEKLIKVGINPFVVETDGKYLIHQLTSLKKNSKLTRINNVKTLHVIRKALPPLLKDLLQLKATGEIVGTATNRVNNYMSNWIVSPNNLSDGIFTSVNATPYFDETTNELTIFLNVVFVGIIESISIPIIVK